MWLFWDVWVPFYIGHHVNTVVCCLVMDGSLPSSLKHIISNAEYYGPSLFLLGQLCTMYDWDLIPFLVCLTSIFTANTVMHYIRTNVGKLA